MKKLPRKYSYKHNYVDWAKTCFTPLLIIFWLSLYYGKWIGLQKVID